MRRRIEKGIYRYFNNEGTPGNIILQFRYRGHQVREVLKTQDVAQGRIAMTARKNEIDEQLSMALDLEMFGDDIKLSEALETMRNDQWSHDTSHDNDSLSRVEQIVAHLGDPRCLDITNGTLRALKRHLESENIGTKSFPRHRKPGTINRYMISLKTVLKAVHAEGLIPKLPNFSKVIVGEKQFRRERLVTQEEFDAVRAILMQKRHTAKSTKARRQVAIVLTIAWNTGMRIGEILDIRFGRHIDMRLETIKITADIAKGKSIRTLKMNPKVVRIFNEITPDKDGVLFPFDVNFVSKCWREARNEMDIDDPHFVPHAIRHTVATKLLRKGIPIEKVQRLLGHESSKTTEIYTHLVGEDIADLLLDI